MNAELIDALRHCLERGGNKDCRIGCPYVDQSCGGCAPEQMLHDAADALEAADIKIADCVAAIDALDDSNDAYIKENERLKKRIEELEAQLLEEGAKMKGEQE